jgi:sensor histidine kinase YesM
MSEVSTQRSRIRWALIVGGWTLYGLFFTSQNYISQAHYRGRVEWKQTFIIWMLCAYVWAALTPAMLWLARRFSFEKESRLRAFFVHLAAGAFFSVFALVVFISLRSLLLTNPDTQTSAIASLRSLVIAEFHAGLLIYWSVIGISHAFDYYSRYRDRELQTSKLETRLAQARLDALKMQLHPHFLFNTLNSISVLMRKDVEAADRMLVQLSNLLRVALSKTMPHEIPLKQELEFLEKYLEIEKTRFRDRLRVKIDVDPLTLDSLVPHLILQPLVENAIRHGIAERETDGVIEIRASRDNGTVQLQVRDNGPGLPADFNEAISEGVGISNTRARLEHLYGSTGSFHLMNADGGGLIATAAIPFHTEPNRPADVEDN